MLTRGRWRNKLYSELLLARFGLLENSPNGGEPDAGIKEAVASIIFAAPRTEVRGASCCFPSDGDAGDLTRCWIVYDRAPDLEGHAHSSRGSCLLTNMVPLARLTTSRV